MKYQIVFSKELEVNADEFAREWNSDSACNELAVAQVEKDADAKKFGLLPNEVFMVLTDPIVQSVACGVTANILYDAIKTFFRKRGSSVSVKYKNDRLSVDHLPL